MHARANVKGISRHMVYNQHALSYDLVSILPRNAGIKANNTGVMQL